MEKTNEWAVLRIPKLITMKKKQGRQCKSGMKTNKYISNPCYTKEEEI